MNLKRQIKMYGTMVLALAAIPGVASAASLGDVSKNWGPNQSLYLGAGAGMVQFDDTIGGDKSDFGWKLFGGFDANQYFGVEGFYTNLGEANGGGRTLKARGFGADGVGKYPMGKWVPLAKVGVWYPSISGSFGSDSSFEWTYGVGVGYDVTNTLGLRVEVERYNADNSATNGKFDNVLWSGNVVWRFH